MPPFYVRGADKINKDLGFVSVPLAPTTIPIYTFVDLNLNNDPDTSGCPYIETVNGVRSEDDNCYQDGFSTQEAVIPCVM